MQKPGKSGRSRGLTDMSVLPEPFEYHRPEVAEEYPLNMVLFPGGICSLHGKVWQYRSLVVDFAITLRMDEIKSAKGDEAHVARYDCCHSEVHKHQFYRSGRHYKTCEREKRTVIASIDDPNTAWDTVNSAYDKCYDDLSDNWEASYRRWDSDGRQY